MLQSCATTPEQLFAALDALGIQHTDRETSAAVHGRAGRPLCAGRVAGGHTKNLFLRDKKYELYLVVALEDAEIDLKGLHRQLGASGRFSFGSSDLLREVWGVDPGAVTPFGAINDTQGRVTVVLDAAMMEHETLNYHPLVNTMTTSIRARRSGEVPAIDRPSAPHRAGIRPRGRTPLTRLHSPRRMTHLIRQEGFRTPRPKARNICCKTAGE